MGQLENGLLGIFSGRLRKADGNRAIMIRYQSLGKFCPSISTGRSLQPGTRRPYRLSTMEIIRFKFFVFLAIVECLGRCFV